MNNNDASAKSQPLTDLFWRSLEYFAYYRLIVACLFLGILVVSRGSMSIGSQDPVLFYWTSIVYVALAIFFLLILARWRLAFSLQLSVHVVCDTLLLTLLMFASGGTESGIAMMVLVVLAGAGLVSQGRMVLYFATLASVLLVLEQSVRNIAFGGSTFDFFRTALISIGFFGSAFAARLLSQRAIISDNLARKRGLELEYQRRINENVIREMQDGVLVVDLAGRIHQANPEAARLLGYRKETPPQTVAECSPALQYELQLRLQGLFESEAVLQAAQSGNTLRARFLPPSETGTVLIFLEDIGRQQQKALQAKLAALGRLTANMAHEIRNPLSAILHASELMGGESREEDDKKLTRIIKENAKRLNNLVIEVEELGRRDRVSPELIDLNAFIRQLLYELSLRDAYIKDRVEVDLPAASTICFDRSHLHRVLANLLGNALRATESTQGKVRIFSEWERVPKRISLHIADDGTGISEDLRDKVFEPFFTTFSSGTGLGLYIARELCVANGARLSLLENAPGGHFCISCAMLCQERS